MLVSTQVYCVRYVASLDNKDGSIRQGWVQLSFVRGTGSFPTGELAGTSDNQGTWTCAYALVRRTLRAASASSKSIRSTVGALVQARSLRSLPSWRRSFPAGL